MTRPYDAKFKKGEQVKIGLRDELERFMHEWHYHDPLTKEQLLYAGFVALIKDVGFFHGGEPIYELASIPGTWHEECLSGVSTKSPS